MRRLIAVPTVLFALAAAGCGDADGGQDTTAAASPPAPGRTVLRAVGRAPLPRPSPANR